MASVAEFYLVLYGLIKWTKKEKIGKGIKMSYDSHFTGHMCFFVTMEMSKLSAHVTP